MAPDLPRLPRGRHGLSPSYVASHQRERILSGVAEVAGSKGYLAMSVEDIVRASGVSRRTFYGLFGDKRQAFFAAFDSVNAHVLELTTKAFTSTDDWPEQVRRGIAALLGFLGAEPAFARMAFLELAMTGPDGLRRLESSIDGFQALLEPGHQVAEHPVPVEIPRMIGAAIVGLLRRQIITEEPGEIRQALPAAVYLCLVAYLGPARAWAESQRAE
jgi:AcrR family transcriptional regulator